MQRAGRYTRRLGVARAVGSSSASLARRCPPALRARWALRLSRRLVDRRSAARRPNVAPAQGRRHHRHPRVDFLRSARSRRRCADVRLLCRRPCNVPRALRHRRAGRRQPVHGRRRRRCTLAVTIRGAREPPSAADSGRQPRRRRPHACQAGVLVALLIAHGRRRRARPGRRRPATLVMPFENPQADAQLYLARRRVGRLLAEFLERYGANPVTREERLSAFERLQLPPAAVLSHATVIKVGQFVGATDVVVGCYELAGDTSDGDARGSIRARRRPPDARSGRARPAERSVRHLRSRGPSAARRDDRGAGRRFQGRCWRRRKRSSFRQRLVAESPATQRTFLEQAAKAAPADDRVRLALWQVHTDPGDHLRALDAAARVPATSLHSRSARYLAALSQIDLKRYDEAFNTLKALQSEVRSAEVLNAMGVVQLRRGGAPPAGRAAYYFSQASQTDPDDADYFFNLGYAYWIDKDPPAADLLAARGRPTRSGRWRCALRARRGAAADGRERPKPRASASWRSACRRATRAHRQDRQRRPGAARPRATEGSSRAAGARGRLAHHASGQRDQARARDVPSRGRAPRLRAGSRPRGRARAPAGALPVSVLGRGASAARARPPAQRPYRPKRSRRSRSRCGARIRRPGMLRWRRPT